MSNISVTFDKEKAQKLNESVYKTSIAGLYFIDHSLYRDDRGFYSELTKLPEVENVIKQSFEVKQVNLSYSTTNVIRGMHAEGWDKIATVVCGGAFCALADIRPESPTFGQVETFHLGPLYGAVRGSLYVSRGIANSFCVPEGEVDYLYLVNELYKDRDKKGDKSISLFDPDLNIRWPIPKDQMVISERDRQAVTLRELFPEKFK